MERRCYLCRFAEGLVEHKEDKKRKFWVRCELDHSDYEPCYACGLFMERKEQRGCH